MNEANSTLNPQPSTALKGQPFVRPIAPEEVAQVKELARADGSDISTPTHVVMRDGQIIGALSIGAIPLVLAWADSKKSRTRDCVHAMGLVENLLSAVRGPGTVLCVPSNPECPFGKVLRDMGYTQHGTAAINLKKVD